MSKNMKLDGFKHQTIFQDYMELQQETEAARNNLMALKQKKLTLQAEVRFLRRRHKLLLENKSSALQEQVLTKAQPTQFRKSNKKKVHMEKIKTLPELPPTGKKKAPRFNMIHEDSLHGVKQQSAQKAVANQRVRINGPKEYQFLDLSRKDDVVESQPRKPVFNMNNQLSREEEKLYEQCELFDPRMQGLTRNGVDSQHTDAQVSMFRNGGKRKVSWQDPVAVRV